MLPNQAQIAVSGNEAGIGDENSSLDQDSGEAQFAQFFNSVYCSGTHFRTFHNEELDPQIQ